MCKKRFQIRECNTILGMKGSTRGTWRLVGMIKGMVLKSEEEGKIGGKLRGGQKKLRKERKIQVDSYAVKF